MVLKTNFWTGEGISEFRGSPNNQIYVYVNFTSSDDIDSWEQLPRCHYRIYFDL